MNNYAENDCDTSPLYKLLFKIERQYPKQCAVEREQLKKVLLDWINHVW